MGNELNKKWSEVLSYRPKLLLSNKERQISSNKADIDNVSKYEYSLSTSNYIENNSLTALNSLKDLKDYNDYLINNICSLLNINNNSSIETIDFNINNDIKLEIYNILSNENDKISELYSQYKKSYFTDINEENIESYNEQIIASIKLLETQQKFHKINYAALNIDSYLNSIISSYCEKSIEHNNTINNLLEYYEIPINTTNKNAVNKSIKNKYDSNKSNYESKYISLLKSSKSNNAINKFNELCNNRNNMITCINADSSIEKSEDSECRNTIIDLKNESVNNAYNSANDLLKIFSYNIELKKEYEKTVEERQYYKNIYNQTK